MHMCFARFVQRVGDESLIRSDLACQIQADKKKPQRFSYGFLIVALIVA